MRTEVQKARNRQLKRFENVSITANSEMKPKEVKEFCKLTGECLDILRHAVIQMGLSARAYFRVIKVARTIADLENSPEITRSHLAEALTYRPRQ